MNSEKAKELVVKAGKRLVESGLIARTWGNVSCRLDEKSFVITPGGRDYHSLATGDIVQVKIADLSYSGEIKPSSEKGLHAAVYSLYPGVNFVIHTHQENASVIAASEVKSIPVGKAYPSLGGEVPCAKYALPGTKALAEKVRNALRAAKSKAVIMKNHGALCLGNNDHEAFRIAYELEKACYDFLVKHYLKISEKKIFDPAEMYAFALLQKNKTGVANFHQKTKTYCHAARTEKGFLLYNSEKRLGIQNNDTEALSPEEARIYQAVFCENKNINHILFQNSPEIRAVACSGRALKPLLDDFAQLVGMQAQNVENNPQKIAKALKRAPAVFIRNLGALCCGKTKDEATAVGLIMQKACKAFTGASLLGKVKPINPLESLLMRFVYLKKYSKQAEKNIHKD